MWSGDHDVPPWMRGIGRASMDRCLDLNQASRAPLPLRRRTARVSDLHVFHAREHPDHIVGIELAQAELHALQHDVGGAGSDKVDGLAVILPRLDPAARKLAGDLVALDDET